jgi:hypothetical protein
MVLEAGTSKIVDWHLMSVCLLRPHMRGEIVCVCVCVCERERERERERETDRQKDRQRG